MSKKEKEKAVLEKFIDEFDRKIKIVDDIEANLIFPNYNGENPDFIVLYKENYIGIDLFELISTVNRNILMSRDEENRGAMNLQHLKSIRDKLGTNLLYQNEELAKVAVERINDKIQNKVKNYVTNKIWLLGYADRPYNFNLLNTVKEDGLEEVIQKYIRDNILYEERIQNVFLFQCLGKYQLFNIKLKAL